MDNWQKHVFDKCQTFLDNDFEYEEHEVQITLNQREAYIVMKALEDRQLNPVIEVKEIEVKEQENGKVEYT